MSDKFQEKIGQIQLIQQNMENFAMQRQQFQLQLSEIEAALLELSKSKNSYKLIGNIMVAANPEDLIKELDEKREMFGIRINTIEKQEEKLRAKFEDLQSEMVKELDKKKKNDKD